MTDDAVLQARLSKIRSCAADWRNVPSVAMLSDLLALYDAQAARLAAMEQALRWAVDYLDTWRRDGGSIMDEWREWVDEQARPALAGAAGERTCQHCGAVAGQHPPAGHAFEARRAGEGAG